MIQKSSVDCVILITLYYNECVISVITFNYIFSLVVSCQFISLVKCQLFYLLCITMNENNDYNIITLITAVLPGSWQPACSSSLGLTLLSSDTSCARHLGMESALVSLVIDLQIFFPPA